MYIAFKLEKGGSGIVAIFNNARVLADNMEGDITYHQIMYQFNTKRKKWIEVGGFTIMKAEMLVKGNQGIQGFGNLVKDKQFKSNGED